jgi:hypothetical protein
MLKYTKNMKKYIKDVGHAFFIKKNYWKAQIKNIMGVIDVND